MGASHLTVDLGNSRCKLVAWAGGVAQDAAILSTASFETHSGLGAEAAHFARRAAPEAVAVVSSVAAPELESELVRALQHALAGRVLSAPDCGLEIALRAPERVGRDRLYAARGAFERTRSSAIVVDAGTALTVDALQFDGRRARFLGGAIAPGPRLLALALARGAARLELVEPESDAVPAGGVRALGRDTREALLAGIVVGFRGAAAELARRVAEESGLAAAPIVLTGGARSFLLAPVSCFDARIVEDAELVHRGLLAAARDAEAAR